MTKRNDELMSIIAGEFQPRYEPNFALGMAHSTGISGFGVIRAYWPLTSVNATQAVYDVSGENRTLIVIDDPEWFRSYLRTYVYLNGTTQYLYRNDEAGLRVSGTETSIGAGNKGFSYACWLSFHTAIGGAEIIASKWHLAGPVNERSWYIERTATGAIAFGISLLGTAVSGVTVTSAAGLLTQQATGLLPFQHVGVTFDPSNLMAIYLNGTLVASLAVGVPASIFGSIADFMIGAYGTIATAAGFAGMRTCQHVMSAMYLPSYYFKNHFEQTRALFGA